MQKSLIGAAMLAAAFTSSAYAESSLKLFSEPGDYIGGGKQYSYSEPAATFQYTENYHKGITVNINAGNEWWTLNLVSGDKTQIKPGVYLNAERFPFQSAGKPGLSFSGSGRGCNTLTGQFEVLEVGYDEAGKLKSLGVNFEQHCEGGVPALYGSLYFNSLPAVGASTQGVSVQRVICRNVTTGQRVRFNSGAPTFDCRKQGLKVNTGDRVTITVQGAAY